MCLLKLNAMIINLIVSDLYCSLTNSMIYHFLYIQHMDLLQMMIEASGEDCDSDDETETTEPPAECPAHKAAPAKTAKTAKTAKAAVMTDSEVYANAMGFLAAGSETTSMTLSYTSYLLALNPDIQEKLQSEIDAYFEENPVSNLILRIACSFNRFNGTQNL